MTKHALLAAAVLTALAAPAGAQTLAAASSTTASSATLTLPERVLPQPTLPERRALASAAFEKPPALLAAKAFEGQKPARADAPFEPELQAKDEWTATDGLRLDWTRVVYKARF
ncbi:MAG: hypothetical protein JWQ29_2860 [Phenylobacterium sp.]|nr:hypothetical protein [Phenylobacterium sp.]